MKFYVASMIFVVLAVFDIGATALAVPHSAVAVLAHLGLVGLGYATVKAFTEQDQRGRRTVALFAGLLCLTTPILGFLVVAALLHCYTGEVVTPKPPVDFVVGNPLQSGRQRKAQKIDPDINEPLIYAFVHAPTNESSQMAVPMLRHRLDRKAVILLEKLRTVGDGRTRLLARSALTSSIENREKVVHHLRRRIESAPGEPEHHLHLAEFLFSSAESGVFGDLQDNSLYRDAERHFSKAAKLNPMLPSAVYGKGMALIRQNHLDDVPACYGRLLAIPAALDPDRHAPRLEAELFAASGNWERVKGVARKMENLPNKSRRFWM